MESSDSSADGKYSDGVYSVYTEQEKVQEGPSHTPSPSPLEKPPKLPIITLACMVLLLICCFVGILVSGLQFSNKVAPGDCLGQSWAMFAVRANPTTQSELGFIVFVTHHQTDTLLLLLLLQHIPASNHSFRNDLLTCPRVAHRPAVCPGPAVHQPASASLTKGRARQPPAALLAEPAPLVRPRRRAPRCRRLGHCPHHPRGRRLQGSGARVMCKSRRLHRRDVSCSRLSLARFTSCHHAGSSSHTYAQEWNPLSCMRL